MSAKKNILELHNKPYNTVKHVELRDESDQTNIFLCEFARASRNTVKHGGALKEWENGRRPPPSSAREKQAGNARSS
jgi:hypothetical protein